MSADEKPAPEPSFAKRLTALEVELAAVKRSLIEARDEILAINLRAAPRRER